MVERKFGRMLDTYGFIDEALRGHGSSMMREHRDMLLAEQDQVLREILTSRSASPGIILAQMNALLTCIGNARDDHELISMAVTACMGHLKGLESAIERSRADSVAKSSPGILDERAHDLEHSHILHAASDRIVIIGPDYRYRFSNLSNARFHGSEPKDLVGMPLWQTTSDAFFAEVSKPAFDRCFAGHPAKFVAAHPGGDDNEIYVARIDPVRDSKGRVVAAFAIASLLPR